MARLLILLCSLVSLAALAEPAPPPPPLPVEYFTRDDLTGRLKISPDGKHFAIIVGRLDASALVFLDVATGAVVGGVRGGKGKEIHDFHWISPSRVVYQIAERQLGVRYASLTGEFFAIDVDGKANRIIYGYRAGEFATGTQVRRREASNAAAELVSVLRGDEKHILIAEYPYRLRGNTWHLNRDAKPEITRLNVYDGRKTSLGTAPLASARVIVDRNDHVRFAVGYDESATLRASWRPEADAPWQSFALPGFIEDSVLPLRFTADQKAVLFSAIAEAKSVSGLYRIELESHEIEELYSHPEFDIYGLVPDLLDQKAVGVQMYTDRPEIHWLEPEDPSAKLLAKLERAFPGQAVRHHEHNFGWKPRDRLCLLRYQSRRLLRVRYQGWKGQLREIRGRLGGSGADASQGSHSVHGTRRAAAARLSYPPSRWRRGALSPGDPAAWRATRRSRSLGV
jgi:hypothetical protein